MSFANGNGDSFINTLINLNGSTLANEDNYTHVTLYDPVKKWSIPDICISKFWESYCSATYDDQTLYVAERNQKYMPVVLDFNLKYYKDSNISEPYDDETLMLMVASIQEAIDELFKVSDSYEELQCCVLVSENGWETGEHLYYKLRLHFPYCKIRNVDFPTLRTKSIRILHDHKVLLRFTDKPIGDWDSIIVKNTHTTPLLMYGSKNSVDEPRLILDKIYHSIDIDDYGDIEHSEELYLENIFNRRHHEDVQKGLISHDLLDDYEIDFWIPLLLSVQYPMTIVRPKEKKEIENTRKVEYESEELTVAAELLKIIGAKRFLDPIYNKEIGKALYNVSGGSANGLNLWVSTVERAYRAAKLPYVDIIEKMNVDYYLYINNPITERTLAWYAKEDNEARYKEWHANWCKESLDKSLSGTHADVAEAFYRLNWLEHICVDPKSSIWYIFHNHRMVEDKAAITLRSSINKRFIKLYEKIRIELCQKSIALEEGREKDKIEDKIKAILKLIKDLKYEPFKNNIIRSSMEHFYKLDLNFYTVMDANLDCMGLPNGVLEVHEDRCIIRPGKPEDYISLKTGVPYREDFHWDHPIVKRFLKYMNCVHRDPDLNWEWRKLTSSLLKGGNHEKIFPIGTGGGGNSKSQVIKTWETAFGEYCFNYPVELLTTTNKNPHGASPALARGKGRHIAITSEPDDEDPMKKKLIKGISGGDRQNCRLLHDNGGDMVASFVMTLWCNDIPIFPNADDPLKDRVVIYPFLSVWKDNAPESFEEQMKLGIFKKDKFFDKQIGPLAQALLWVAVQDYPSYKKEGLKKDIPVMREAIEKYWEESNVYFQYKGERIMPEIKDEKGHLNEKFSKTITETYTNFSKWFKQCYPGTPVPDRKAFKKEFNKEWHEARNGRWYGMSFVEEERRDNDDKDEDAFDFAKKR